MSLAEECTVLVRKHQPTGSQKVTGADLVLQRWQYRRCHDLKLAEQAGGLPNVVFESAAPSYVKGGTRSSVGFKPFVIAGCNQYSVALCQLRKRAGNDEAKWEEKKQHEIEATASQRYLATP